MVSTNASPISFPQTPHYRQFAVVLQQQLDTAKAKLRDIAHSGRAAAWQEGQCRTIVNELLAAISLWDRRRTESLRADYRGDHAAAGGGFGAGERLGEPDAAGLAGMATALEVRQYFRQTSVLLTLGATVGLVRAVGDRLHEIGEHQLVAEIEREALELIAEPDLHIGAWQDEIAAHKRATDTIVGWAKAQAQELADHRSHIVPSGQDESAGDV